MRELTYSRCGTSTKNDSINTLDSGLDDLFIQDAANHKLDHAIIGQKSITPFSMKVVHKKVSLASAFPHLASIDTTRLLQLLHTLISSHQTHTTNACPHPFIINHGSSRSE